MYTHTVYLLLSTSSRFRDIPIQNNIKNTSCTSLPYYFISLKEVICLCLLNISFAVQKRLYGAYRVEELSVFLIFQFRKYLSFV